MTDCTIIGAGISGLIAARILSDSGHRVRVLEKSRGVGGRMATRRQDTGVFDHGAQFFTVRDRRFLTWVERWRTAGLVESWYELAGSGPHFRAAPSMTGIAKHLAESLDVVRETEISRASHDGSAGSWSVETADGQVYTSTSLITTAPVPQSLALLERGGFTIPEPQLGQLRSIRFHRCIVAMAILDRPSALTANHGAIKLDGEPVQWIADNQRKGISPEACAITIHSTPAFAEEHWESPNTERIQMLLEAAAPLLGDAQILSSDGHRWGFSQPTSAFETETYSDAEHALAIAGDGLAGGRVEGAAVSGIAAAESIRNLLHQ